MKKVTLVVLAMALTIAVGASDFYGITVLKPSNHILSMLITLAEGNREKAEVFHKEILEQAPELAKLIKLDDLRIPCADCHAEKDPTCELCNGTEWIVDPIAVKYFLTKFQEVLGGKSKTLKADISNSTKAWKEAAKVFDRRKQRVLAREIFQGAIMKIDSDALVIRLSGNEGWIYLTGCDTESSRVGESLVGYMWPMGNRTYPYGGEDGKKVAAKQYTVNLWQDFEK